MFNKSQIMSRAWELRRSNPRRYDRSYALRIAWGEAKRAPADPLALRADAIRYELATLSTRSFQQNVEPIRRRLEAELSALAA